MKVKIGIMMGLNEDHEEVRDVMRADVHHGVVVGSSYHAREQSEALR